MPPLPTIANVYRVAMNWGTTPTGQTATNVMHFSAATGGASGVWTALNANVTANMWFCSTNNWQVKQVAITPLDGHSATLLESPAGTNWTGAIAGGDYLPSTAAVVSMSTSARGRRYRGRLYLPGVAESAVTNGQITIVIATWQSAWNTFLSTMSTAAVIPCVASYGHSMVRKKNADGTYTISPTTWAPFATNVSAFNTEALVATQRRRQSRNRGG
jgi:hypothetical protein